VPCGGLVALLVGRSPSAPRMVFLRVKGILPNRKFLSHPTLVVARPSIVYRHTSSCLRGARYSTRQFPNRQELCYHFIG
jgi:hypothetical protein